MQHGLGHVVVELDHTFERREGDLCGRGVAERHVVQRHRHGTVGYRGRVGGIHHRGLQIENLQHPLEADQGGHHVDLDVGERCQRSVQTVEVRGEGHERADAEGAADRGHTTEPVHESGRQRRQQTQRCHEDPGVHGLGDADVADPARPVGEGRRLLVGATEELHHQRPGDVEALGHHLTHLAVETVALTGDVGQSPTHEAGRDDEQRKQAQSQQGELPRQHEHRAEGGGHDGHVPHHVGEHRGEGLLRPHHVAVQTGHQRPCLRPAEEADRHALHVVEHLGPQIVDEPLADACREPTLSEAHPGGHHRQGSDQPGQCDDQPATLLGDAPVDDLAVHEGNGGAHQGVDDHQGEEEGDRHPVGPGEGHDATNRARGEPVAGDRGILGERMGETRRHGALRSVERWPDPSDGGDQPRVSAGATRHGDGHMIRASGPPLKLPRWPRLFHPTRRRTSSTS